MSSYFYQTNFGAQLSIYESLTFRITEVEWFNIIQILDYPLPVGVILFKIVEY